MAALTLASQAVGTVVQYQTQSAQADAQAKANENQRILIDQEQALANLDAQRQRNQEYQAAAAEANNYQLQAAKQRAALEALIGESGGGVSANRKLAAVGIQQGQDLATMADNATKVQAELGYGESSASMTAASKKASIRAPDAPSALGSLLTLGSAGLQYGNRMNQIKVGKI